MRDESDDENEPGLATRNCGNKRFSLRELFYQNVLGYPPGHLILFLSDFRFNVRKFYKDVLGSPTWSLISSTNLCVALSPGLNMRQWSLECNMRIILNCYVIDCKMVMIVITGMIAIWLQWSLIEILEQWLEVTIGTISSYFWWYKLPQKQSWGSEDRMFVKWSCALDINTNSQIMIEYTEDQVLYEMIIW